MMKRRVARFLSSADCPICNGKRLKPEAFSVKFAGLDIAEISRLPLKGLGKLLEPYVGCGKKGASHDHPEKVLVVQRIMEDPLARLEVLLDLGLGYLTSERSTPTLSPGELQRLRLATQVRSNLFGVVYVLDEPSAGLHPADTEALLRALDRLKAAGNSLFVVEHELDVVRHADWIVDVGPAAGEQGGEILYSGTLSGLADVTKSQTRRSLFAQCEKTAKAPRSPREWLKLRGVTRNNLARLDVDIPLGIFTSVTGISGSGKSSLVSQFLVETVGDKLGQRSKSGEDDDGLDAAVKTLGGEITEGLDKVKRLVVVDQKPIGRTPRSNLATYTGFFDHVRKLFAATKQARARRYDAGRFSFNVAKGRCETCKGEGFVCVELLFLPSVYAPCPTCKGARYNAKTLEIKIRDKSIADVLAVTVDAAFEFFPDDASLRRSLGVLREVGLGYIRLGQAATELSGGEAQRIKLVTELAKVRNDVRAGPRQKPKHTLYVLDEPTVGLHMADVEQLLGVLHRLVDAGNTVVVIEHNLDVMAEADWILDMGPDAGERGGRIVACGTPAEVARKKARSHTGLVLDKFLRERTL
jgi:excinuclease ABC subunit A